MDLLNQIKANAKKQKTRIVLPEGTEIRTLKAADQIIKEELADLILIGETSEIEKIAKENDLSNISKAQIIDPKNHAKKDEYSNILFELRKSKGLTKEQSDILVEDPLYLGVLMIKAGDADGEVAGAQNRTGDVLRPAFQVIKTVPGISVVSGAFLLILRDKEFGENGVMVLADCAVHPNPTAPELAEIAVMTGKTTREIAGFEPKIAMLSFSTKGSGKHEMVDKVVEATRLAQEMAPDMMIDGELQTDAAISPVVAEIKAPNSKVAGHANVLVFPTLETGNIAYKFVERIGHAQAIGPILQGMAAPINDLSRGCSISDIVNLVAITANQAQKMIKK